MILSSEGELSVRGPEVHSILIPRSGQNSGITTSFFFIVQGRLFLLALLRAEYSIVFLRFCRARAFRPSLVCDGVIGLAARRALNPAVSASYRAFDSKRWHSIHFPLRYRPVVWPYLQGLAVMLGGASIDDRSSVHF